MCKAKSSVWPILVFLWLILALAAAPVWAEKSTPPETAPSDNPPVGVTPTTPPPVGVAPSTPPPTIDIQSLQQVPSGQGNVPIINPYTNEIIDPESLKPKEKTWWEKTYPYALDVAIGVGAALVTFGVIKLARMKKREK